MSIRALKDKSGQVVTEPDLIANTLNNQFKSVFVVEPSRESGTFPEFENRRSECFDVIDLIDGVTAAEVEKRLLNLCSSKACGVDEVNPYVLKKCAKELSVPLSIIFTRSLKARSLVIGEMPKLHPFSKRGVESSFVSRCLESKF